MALLSSLHAKTWPLAAIAFWLSITVGTADAQQRIVRPAPAACPAGMKPCAGIHGSQCYSPIGGATCRSGVVCGQNQQLCDGRYGATCYTPAQGQQCLQGLVCQWGQSLCIAGGMPHCYSPGNGEQCQ